MTVARDSQTVVEVLRTNTAVKGRASQTATEVLRTNTAVKARASQMAVELLRQNNAEAPLGTGSQPITIICS